MRDGRDDGWPPRPRLPGGLAVGPARLLGVDAGGSGTRAVVAEDGRVVEQMTTEPMNALLTVDLADRLATLATRAGVGAVGIGMPGVRSEVAAGILADDVARRCGCPVRVAPDAVAARLGAFLGGPGVVVAAGTGSVAIGWDGRRTARAGGHGFLLGDEGGAYWIGGEAARSTLRWCDGMGGSEALSTAVLEAVGLEAAGTDADRADAEGLVRVVHSRPTDREVLARLAPIVTSLAATDSEAARIAAAAAHHLAALVSAVRRRLGPLPVAGVGGVFGADAVWRPFADLTDARRPMAAPSVGALFLAADALAGAGAQRHE